jgi:hypothetical protein
MKKLFSIVAIGTVLVSSQLSLASMNPGDPNDVTSAAGRRHLAETRKGAACPFSSEGNFTGSAKVAKNDSSAGRVSDKTGFVSRNAVQ